MNASKFDRDPEALAWARGKAERFVAKMRDFERQARKAGDAPERERQWRVFGNIAESHFIGGTGCVVAAFDERLPSVLDAIGEGGDRDA